jgi:hypothetical protein
MSGFGVRKADLRTLKVTAKKRIADASQLRKAQLGNYLLLRWRASI